MIISASRRTDIPSFYPEWFANRVREGFVCVRNPMNIHQVSRVSLDPALIDCIVFWTKNPAPMLPYLDAFSDYTYYFQATLTGYGHDVEANLPDKHKVLLPAFKELSRRIGPERVIWRYDPILFNAKYTPEYHLRAVRSIAEELEGCTEKCVISFVDTYRKNKKSIEALDAHDTLPTEGEFRAFAAELASIVREYGMACASCAEKVNLADCGIEHNCCIDRKLIERLLGCPVGVKKDKTQRLECGCVASIDIGSYNTCRHGCRYCYANFSPEAVERNCAAYDPSSPLLCDQLRDDDVVTERKMKRLASDQTVLPL